MRNLCLEIESLGVPCCQRGIAEMPLNQELWQDMIPVSSAWRCKNCPLQPSSAASSPSPLFFFMQHISQICLQENVLLCVRKRYCYYWCFNLKHKEISNMALVGLGSFWVRLKRNYPSGMAVVIPAEKKIDIFLQYLLSFFGFRGTVYLCMEISRWGDAISYCVFCRNSSLRIIWPDRFILLTM